MIKLSGLTPAVFTPFDKTGAINLAQIQPYADKLVTDGADGVFVCGSTGECTSMTIAERKSVLEAWVNATSGRMRVIAHVGGTCQADCIELARHAAGLGVDAVGAIAPFYFKPASVGELVAFYKPIAAAIAPIPFYSYHMPSVTGINLPMKEFLEKGSREIPNLNGIKFTSNNFMEMLSKTGVSTSLTVSTRCYSAAWPWGPGEAWAAPITIRCRPTGTSTMLSSQATSNAPVAFNRNRRTSYTSSSATAGASAAGKPL